MSFHLSQPFELCPHIIEAAIETESQTIFSNKTLPSFLAVSRAKLYFIILIFESVDIVAPLNIVNFPLEIRKVPSTFSLPFGPFTFEDRK